MPELAELRLTADFVNQSSTNRIFKDVWKNPVHKLQTLDLSQHLGKGETFRIRAISRGKELKLEIIPETSNPFPIIFTLGMGGHFSYNLIEKRAKHTHFSFLSVDEQSELEFVDVRRFGRWKISDWNPDRSPDLTTETDQWKSNILNNLNHKDFNRPFYEWLMNQRWINGYGNYLRAELVQRMDINPFATAREVITKYQESFFSIAPLLPDQAYLLGGGQIYSWSNPLQDMDIEPYKWKEWMRAYKNPSFNNILDRNGRRFWYDPKWKITL
jgi:endonuclease VIII-like 1